MPRVFPIAAVLLSVAAVAACERRVSVDQVPVGTEVQVTRDDGALVQGKLTARDEKTVKVDVGATSRTVPRESISDVRVVDATKPVALPPAAKFREVTVPAGTTLMVRLESSVSSATSHAEDTVVAELAEPVVIDGVEAIPARSAVRGEVTSAAPAGKVKGLASLALDFDALDAFGRTYPIGSHYARTAQPTKEQDAKKIGIPAAAGTVIGAVVGGKKGAAIGAAAGAGAGTAVVLTTKGREVELPSGTVLSVSLDRTLDVHVPLVNAKK